MSLTFCAIEVACCVPSAALTDDVHEVLIALGLATSAALLFVGTCACVPVLARAEHDPHHNFFLLIGQADQHQRPTALAAKDEERAVLLTRPNGGEADAAAGTL